MSKNGNNSVTSYGVILYTLRHNAKTNSVWPSYLMIRRRDSVTFVEFLRGKYSLTHREYIKTLFTNMTVHERQLIRDNSFDELWTIACGGMFRQFTEHNSSREKYKALKLGMNVEGPDGKKFLFDINHILETTTSQVLEPQWEFPKGRRNSSNENNVDCAVREFEEETAIHRSKIFLSGKICPITLEKLGCNGVLYRSVYFIAKCIDRVDLTALNDTQKREISAVSWFDYNGVVARLHNEDQIKTFEKLNKKIIETMLTVY